MSDSQFPVLRQTVLDTPDPRGLAEFYRELFGYAYSAGDEPGGEADRLAAELGQPVDWLVLVDDRGRRVLGFQLVADLPRPVWPDGNPPQMLHLDFQVADRDQLARHRDRALALGSTILRDDFDDDDEPIYVFTDLSGHPFCIFVAAA